MTENERRETAYAALSDLDALDSELEDIVHLLCLLDEGLTDDMEPIQRGESWGAEHLRGRWPLHLSTLNVIRYRVATILGDLQEGLKKGYAAIDIQR